MNESELGFELTNSQGMKILKTAGLWPSVKGLQSLRLGFGFGWGLEGLSREEFRLSVAGDLIPPAISLGEIPGFRSR